VTLNAGNLRRLQAGGRQDCLPHSFSQSLTVAALMGLGLAQLSLAFGEVRRWVGGLLRFFAC